MERTKTKTKTDEHLVARLSPKAAKVLLALLLARNHEVSWPQAEFAIRSGLGGRSIPLALAELETFGLVAIIPRRGKSALVRLLVQPGEPQAASQDDPAMNSVSVSHQQVSTQLGQVDQAVPELQALWGGLFPEHRLSDATALRFLRGRSFEDVRAVVLDAKENAREPIRSPRAFIEAALNNADKRRQKDEQPDAAITDDLRNLAVLGRERYGKF